MMSIAASIVTALVSLSAPGPANTNPPKGPALPPDVRLRAEKAIDSALAYLAANQAADGGWEAQGKSHLGVSALVLKCFLQDDGHGPDHPASKRGLEFVKRFAQPDGGIYPDGDGHKNYSTSVALMALASFPRRDEAVRERVNKAQDFLRTLQWDDGEGHERSSPWFGGAGYGSGKRPDLSNTQLMLEALHDSGLPPDDPAFQRAVVFISRSQMMADTNDQPFAKEGGDGGFIYSPANGGESKAGTEVVDGKPRLRSYGSMTYAGFKSLLYANVERDDPRVKAAVEWIRSNYTLDHNPNMPGERSREGLYYYYHIFARAMRAWGEERVTDREGAVHPWRKELCEKLISLQKENGSWINEQDRWMEGNAALVTAYAALALQTVVGEK